MNHYTITTNIPDKQATVARLTAWLQRHYKGYTFNIIERGENVRSDRVLPANCSVGHLRTGRAACADDDYLNEAEE